MNGVSQDNSGIREVVEEIRTAAEDYKKTYEQIFQLMTSEVNTEGRAWWGPNAKNFNNQFAKKETDFLNAYNNIINMATNLEEQANAWQQFENKG